MAAIIKYRPDSQKIKGYFDQVLTSKVLRDICLRVTGQKSYKVEKDTSFYNKGRLMYIEYKGIKNYVSLSEVNIEGRNQSLQSVPTAINLFYADGTKDKRLFYYFLPHNGNAFTNYHVFVYRLLMTAGVEFLNIADYAPIPILPYGNVDEIIDDRKRNHNTSLTLEKNEYLTQQDKTILRSPTYVYNLLNRIGNKHCALCDCEIPEIIQGAHVWSVADIAHRKE